MKNSESLQGGQAESIAAAESRLRQRILVVEDDADIRRMNADILECYGYAVETAEDGAAAWDSLEKKTYDLVITDYNMPKVSGVELIKKMHAGQLAVPVIMVTGDLPTWEFAEPWIEPARILLKPYNLSDLLDMVKEVLHLNTVATEEPALPPNWEAPDKTDGTKINFH
ncbi:MAG TPA: response regulator [Verrucomicrobiae bacterium]|nr:response regulator [Verrucomicrobiae bacterium]